MLNPNTLLKAQVLKRLMKFSFHILHHLSLYRYREIHAHFQVLTCAKFCKELHAKTVPDLGWDCPNEPKGLLLWARSGL